MAIKSVLSSVYSRFQPELLGQNNEQAEDRNSGSESFVMKAKAQDTVQISEGALQKLHKTSQGGCEEENKDPATASEDKKNMGSLAPSRVMGVEVKDPKMGEDVGKAVAKETVESIRKQIIEVEKKLEKAEERMQEAQMKLEQAKADTKPETRGDTPEVAAKHIEAEAEAGATTEAPQPMEVDTSEMEAAAEQMINMSIAQTEMQSISQEIKTLNGELMALNTKLAVAMDELYGTSNGPPGAAGGTPTRGSVGGSASGGGFRGMNMGK